MRLSTKRSTPRAEPRRLVFPSALRVEVLSTRYDRPMIITTMNDLPGYRVDEIHGEVFGLTIRSRNAASTFGAGLKSIVGGELKGMTKMLQAGRIEAQERLAAEAEAKGANAIIAFRFDTSDFGGMGTEICAYGTAVRVTKL